MLMMRLQADGACTDYCCVQECGSASSQNQARGVGFRARRRTSTSMSKYGKDVATLTATTTWSKAFWKKMHFEYDEKGCYMSNNFPPSEHDRLFGESHKRNTVYEVCF